MENVNLTEIKELIISTEKSKIYKSGIITDTYNKIFNKYEKPTNCGSCLRTFFLKIKNFYTETLKQQMESEIEVIEPVNEIMEEKVEEVIEDKPKSKGKKKK